MLHMLSPAPQAFEHDVIYAMFAARKSVFVDLLKWDLHVLADSLEVDQFDTTEAQYLVLTDAGGGHLGSARLLPTLQPHILDSFYGGLCTESPPRGDRVFEITRFCLDRSLRAPERRRVRNALVRALADHALATRITTYSAIAETAWARQILEFGWRATPLGPPRMVDGSELMALQIDIDGETPRRLAARGILSWLESEAASGEQRHAA